MAAQSPVQAEEALFCDALPGLVLLLAADGTAVYANRAWADFCGRDADELLGSGWRGVLAPAAAEALLQRVALGRDFELEIALHDGAGHASHWCCSARWRPGGGHCACIFNPSAASGAVAARTLPTPQDRFALLELLADNLPVLMAYYGAHDFRCRFASRQYARLFGRDVEALLGSTFEEVIGPAAVREIQPRIDRMLAQRLPVVYERLLAGGGAGERWIEVQLWPHLGPAADAASSRTTLGVFVLITDITAHRLAERAVHESEERLAKFMQASAEGVVFHRDGFITDANPPVCELLGYTLEELLGRRTLEFIAPDHVAKVAEVIASGQETAYESVALDKNGRRIPVEFIVRTMLRNGERLRMTIVRDLRDRHAALARIHHLAHHDALTGLPNRVSFMEQLQQQIARPRRGGPPRLALLFIDLDHFKRVNDSLGHLVGDTLLRTVAARITASLRATDLVSRFGGDEFVVLLTRLSEGPQHRIDAEEVALKLLASIGAPLYIEGRLLSVTPSIGLALYPDDGSTPEELVKHADTAMYLAKARGRANHRFFDRDMADSAFAELVLESQLAQALDRGEFELHFQPQVRSDDGRLAGAEALIRWKHPERGLLPGADFIPLAEQRQLMLPIGQWVINEALRCALHWRAIGLPVAPVSVNLSSVQFQSIGFVEAIAQLLPPDGTARGLLEFELTERMLMDDLADVTARLARLKAMGLRISIDDFGTGYSSLGHLKELPIDRIKIDRSFIHDLPADNDSAAIASAIIQLGRGLGLRVTAEGVETEAQRAFLADRGCDEVQGFLIGAPLPQAAFEAWVRARQPLG